MRYTKNEIIYIGFIFILMFFLGIACFFLNHEQAIGFSVYNYALFQFLILAIILSLSPKKRIVFFLSPSFLAASYVTINFFIGSIIFNKGLVDEFLLIPYQQSWKSYQFIMAYFNFINTFIIAIFFVSKKIKIPFQIKLLKDLRRYPPAFLKVVAVILIVLFSQIELKLDFLGAQGSLSPIPISIGAILLLVLFSKNPKLWKRIFWYILLISGLALISWEDKRNAIFLILPILLLESKNIYLTLSLKKIFMVGTFTFIMLYLILIMSIRRGYGEYEVKNIWQANNYILDYIKSENFVSNFMQNLEISYVYFFSNDAIEKILKNPKHITYGSTIIKPLFVFIPRKYFSKKPESIIHHYTSTVSKKYRQLGGSWVISIQSELFWNFHFLGIFAAIPLFFFFNCIYMNILYLVNRNNIINFIPLLYCYKLFLILFRGSGLDLFFVLFTLSIILFFALKIILINIPMKSKSYGIPSHK